jgi:predicted amidohydrolase YtcJ
MTSTLYRGGLVHAASDPFAEAILIDDGVVTWIGANDTAAGLAARTDRVIDLDGALVAPAFVDAHVHLLETGLALESVDLSPSATPTRAAAFDALAAGARRLDATDPGGTQALLAFGWDDAGWGATPLTREELDAVAAGRPVYAAHVDVHHGVVSSALAASAGLHLLRGWDESGLVVGEALRAARQVTQTIPASRRTRAYRAALNQAAALGIAAVHEMSAPHTDSREGLREVVRLAQDEAVPQVVAYRGELVASADEARDLLADLPFLAGIGGDLNIDGTIAARTAALRQPYSGGREPGGREPGGLGPAGADGRGLAYLDAATIAAHLAACSAVGVQGGFHAVGDRAMDLVIAGLDEAAATLGAGPLRLAQHRIEHGLFVDAAALASLLLYGVSLSIQPAWAAAWAGPHGLWTERLGLARAANVLPFADFASAGIPLAFGSDSPVTPLHPWQAVRAAVSHEDPDQRLSGRAAFRAHTRGGWRIAGLDETGAGELTVGAPAHLAVWRAQSYGVLSSGRGIASWSAEARAGQALLPDVHADAPEPVCLQTVRAGVPIYDTFE